MLQGCSAKWRQMAGSWPREAARPRSPEGSRRGGSAQLYCPSKRVTVGHSPCMPLVSTLNGDHVCPDLAPVGRDGIQGNGELGILPVAQRERVGWSVQRPPHTKTPRVHKNGLNSV